MTSAYTPKREHCLVLPSDASLNKVLNTAPKPAHCSCFSLHTALSHRVISTPGFGLLPSGFKSYSQFHLTHSTSGIPGCGKFFRSSTPTMNACRVVYQEFRSH